jgi:hypothetical protein
MMIAAAVDEESPLRAALTALSFGERPMQQDLLANGNHAPYLAQALTPPILGAAGMMGGYGGTQGFGPQFGNPGLGQFGQGQFGQGPFGQPGQGNSGTWPGGNAAQPGYGYQGQGYGYQGLQQQGLGQPLAASQQLAAQHQQQIAGTLHQLAHHAAAHAATQAKLGQQIAAVLSQLAHQCAWQAQMAAQNRHGGVGSQPVYGQPYGNGQADGTSLGQAGGFNRLLW